MNTAESMCVSLAMAQRRELAAAMCAAGIKVTDYQYYIKSKDAEMGILMLAHLKPEVSNEVH